MNRRTEGFTLIELLIVIAIICILVAILFPVFATAREKARQATCQSNMRQIGMAFRQYSQDNDEKLVSSGTGWAGLLMPYTKNGGLCTCPDDLSTPPVAAGTLISYGFNSNLDGVDLARFSAPANTIELFEAAGDAVIFNGNKETGPDTSEAGNGISLSPASVQYATGLFPRFKGTIPKNIIGSGSIPLFSGLIGRHSNGANYLATDGHVKWLNPNTVSCGYQSIGFNVGGYYGASTNPTTPATAPFAPEYGGATVTTTNQTTLFAAGAQNPNYAMTFSWS